MGAGIVVVFVVLSRLLILLSLDCQSSDHSDGIEIALLSCAAATSRKVVKLTAELMPARGFISRAETR